MSGDPSRQLPGSTRPRTHSPSNHPLNVPIERQVSPTHGTAGLLSAGTGQINTLRPLPSGWQVWGPESLAPPENDIPANVHEEPYRVNPAESWTSPALRFATNPTSDNLQPSSSLDDSHAQLNLHAERQRQGPPTSFSGPVPIDNRAYTSRNVHLPLGFHHEPTNDQPSFHRPPLPSSSLGPPFPAHPLSSMSSPQAADPAFRAVTRASPPDAQIGESSRSIPHILSPQLQHGINFGQEYHSYAPDFPPHQPPPVPSFPQPYPSFMDPSSLPSPPHVHSSIPRAPYNNPSPQNLAFSSMDLLDRQRMENFHGPSREMPYSPPSPIHFPLPVSPFLAQPNPLLSQMPSDNLVLNPYSISPPLLAQNLLPGPLVRVPQHPNTPMGYLPRIPMMLPAHGMLLYPQMFFPMLRDFPALAIRSPVLEDFRQNKHRNWELNDILGHIVEFSTDQYGSRFVQNKIEVATLEERQTIFGEIFPVDTLRLCHDVYGNYVIQKLFEHGTERQRQILAGALQGHILVMSCHMYGCRVVQKAIECAQPDEQIRIMGELEPNLMLCVKDSHGNHVIQKLVQTVSPEHLRFIQSFRGIVNDLASHLYGCRVLQRCFESLPDEYSRPLLEELHFHSLGLMQDPFGNYIIQHLLEHGKPQDKALLVSKLRANLLLLSRHKFASNVCEKALKFSSPEVRKAIIEDIIGTREPSPVVLMMRDQYANYVLKTAMELVRGEQKEILYNKVRPQLSGLRRRTGPNSKHLQQIERLL